MRTLTMRELMCAPVDEFAGLPPVDSDADPLRMSNVINESEFMDVLIDVRHEYAGLLFYAGPSIAAILQSHFVRRYGNLLLLMKVSNALRVSSKWARCRLLMDFLPSPQTRSMGFLLGL